MDAPTRVSINCRVRRQKLNMTQRELAEILTMHADGTWAQPQVSNLETGRFAVTLKTLEALAKALRTDCASLLEMPTGYKNRALDR